MLIAFSPVLLLDRIAMFEFVISVAYGICCSRTDAQELYLLSLLKPQYQYKYYYMAGRVLSSSSVFSLCGQRNVVFKISSTLDLRTIPLNFCVSDSSIHAAVRKTTPICAYRPNGSEIRVHFIEIDAKHRRRDQVSERSKARYPDRYDIVDLRISVFASTRSRHRHGVALSSMWLQPTCVNACVGRKKTPESVERGAVLRACEIVHREDDPLPVTMEANLVCTLCSCI